MIGAFLRIPLRFWLRIGVVASLIWLPVTILRNWWTWTAEIVHSEMHHLQLCHSGENRLLNGCMALARQQFESNRLYVWPMAAGESVVQLAMLWIIGCVVLMGMRWACRALPAATSA